MIQKKEEQNKSGGILSFLNLTVNIAIFIVMMMVFGTVKETNQRVNEKLTTIESVSSGTGEQASPSREFEPIGEIERPPATDDTIQEDEENSTEDKEDEDEESESSSSNAEITAKEIVEAYLDDKEGTNEKYQNQKTTISGEIVKIEETDSDKVNIILDGGDNGTISCLSKITDENTAQTIKDEVEGQDEVVIEGIIEDFYEDVVELENCSAIFN